MELRVAGLRQKASLPYGSIGTGRKICCSKDMHVAPHIGQAIRHECRIAI
jgi:hypothetical protein